MLSLGSREDVRKGIGFGGVEEGHGGMEEDELEEGEACSDREEDRDAVDPDVALSYIDEKIKDVLGHFQKDFEGDVCIENLGAKFGAYGSFLPAYPRSPMVVTQPRSPQRLTNNNFMRSPPQSEVAFQNTSIPTNSLALFRNNCNFASQAWESAAKKDLSRSASNASDSSPSRNTNENDLKTLKVRIKVGSENGKVRSDTEIYTVPNLEISPAFSPEGSPHRGFSPGAGDGPYGTPLAIFQFYSCLCAPKLVAYLLSPVPESLSRLVEKKTACLEDCSGDEVINVKISSDHFADGRTYAEKTSQVKSLNGKEEKNDAFIICKKRINIESLRGKESVSNAQNTTILSKHVNEKTEGLPVNKAMKDSDICKESDRIIENEASPESMKKELLDTNFHKIGRKSVAVPSKGKTTVNPSLEDKVVHHVKVDAVSHDVSADFKKLHKSNYDNGCDSSLVDLEGLQRPKPRLVAPAESVKSKVLQRATPPDVQGEKTLYEKGKSSGRKSKTKRDQASDTPSVEFLKEDAGAAFRAPLKETKKSFFSKGELSKGKLNTPKLVKDRSSSGDCVINNASPRTTQHGEDKIDAPGSILNIYKKVPEDSKPNTKKHGFAEKPKDKTGSKMVNTFSSSEASNKRLQDASLVNNCSTSNLEPKDNWVCCDKCHKWRLLPYDTNPDDLPKKWLCSMQTWLPEMNSCSFTEEETKAAFNALYHLPPDTQIATSGHQDAVTSSAKVVDPRHLHTGFDLVHFDTHGIAKKKFIARNASQDHGQLALSQTTSPPKEIPFTSSKSRSLNEVDGCSRELDIQDKPGLQCTSKSTDFNADKLKHKPNKKQSSADGYQDEGNFFGQKSKKSKLKNKRDFTEDNPVPSKKIKLRDRSKYELDHRDSSTKVPAKNLLMQQDRTSTKDSKFELDELEKNVKASVEVVANEGMHDHRFPFDDGSRDNMKKRKVKESEKTQISKQSNARLEVQEDTNGSLPRKEKKVKHSRPDEKETSMRKFEQTAGKSSLVTRIPLPSSREHFFSGMEDDQGDVGKTQLLQRNDDGIDTLKREFGYSLNSNAATSSSSKISGSHKSRTNVERRGSPVESVSSSPLRKSTVKLTDKVPKIKNDTTNGGYSASESPEKYLQGGADGIHGQMMPKEQKTISTAQVGSLGGDRVLEPRDQMEADHYQESNAKDLLFADIFGIMDDEASPSHDDLQMKPEAELSSEWPSRYPEKPQGKDHDHHEEKHPTEENCKNLKGSTMRSKEMQKNFKHDISKSKIKVLNSFGDQDDFCPTKDAGGTNHYGHTKSCEDLRNECSHFLKDQKKELVNNGEEHPSEGKENNHASSRIQKNMDASSSHMTKLKVFNPSIGGQSIVSGNGGNSSNQENIQTSLTTENHKSSCKLLLSRADKSEIKSGRLAREPFPASKSKEDVQIQLHPAETAANKGTRGEAMSAEARNSDASKVKKESGKLENQNGRYNSSSRHKTPNGVDLPATSRRSGNQYAATVIKEATDLKHTANRLKKEGSVFESTGLYFQAALKFLHGASLLELSNFEGIKQGNMESSMQLYSQTAKLCEFCAHEYDKLKEMAAAALAYKCMEVAYLKVVYSTHSGSMKDCRELKTSLPIGESPSSSASDVDNPNNLAKLNKAAMVKAMNSPQAGNHIIAARNRPKFDQILAFADSVNSAMEASRRSLNAFASANASLENGQNAEAMLAVRKVLDFSFHDVEGLLRLVRLSMEFIAR